MRIKLFEEYSSGNYDNGSGYERDTFEEGDIVCIDNRHGLIISKRYQFEENDYFEDGYDIYYRSLGGAIYHEDINDIEHCYDIDYSDMSAYVSIAKRKNYIINIPLQYQEDFPNEHEESVKRKQVKKFKI